MSSQCRIYLENYGGTYYCNSEIRGRVECYFDDETKIRGIKIRLVCHEHNEWTDTEEYLDTTDNKYKTRFVTFTGDNEVLFLEQLLHGTGAGTENMPMGKHVYPFTFTLPQNIPSTFNGPYGSISYKLKSIVDRPMRTDYEDNFNVVVNSPIDFNFLPDELQQPSYYSDDKTVCCWCCKGGNLNMDVEMQKLALVPGEAVNLKITVTNLSNESVEKLQVELKKVLKFHVQSPSGADKDSSDNLLSLMEHGVGAHGEYTYNLQLELPDYVEIPNFAGCNLFSATYILTIICKMPSCTSDLEIKIFPKLGHIQKAITQPPQMGINDLPTYPAGLTAPGFYPPPNSTAPYPNLEEKPLYPPAPPTAPYMGNLSQPTAPPLPEIPPPSYDQIEKLAKNN